MPIWQRMGITILAMVATSFVAGLLWRALFHFGLPSYMAGLIGGITAIPIWELLKRIDIKTSKN